MRFPSRIALGLVFTLGSATLARSQPATVIIVRHAEKASATEQDPILSAAGTQRAHDLAAALADAHVGSIITTQFQRTRLTAADVIAATGLIPIVVAAGGPSHIADVAAAIKARPAGEVVLVVGHSNTITGIVAALGGPKLPAICDSQYSQMFVIHMSGDHAGSVVRAHYGASDPRDPACKGM